MLESKRHWFIHPPPLPYRIKHSPVIFDEVFFFKPVVKVDLLPRVHEPLESVWNRLATPARI